MHFVSDTRGSTASIFACILGVAVLSAGAAIDVGRANSAKAHLQDALDATVIELSANAGIDQATDVLNSNYVTSAVTGKTKKRPTAEFTKNADGSVSASAKLEVENVILGLAGFKEFTIQVKAKAAAVALTNSIFVTNIKVGGMFAKDIFLIEKDPDGNVVKETKLLSYDFDFPTRKSTITPDLSQVEIRASLSQSNTAVFRMRSWPNYVYSGGSSRNTVPYVDQNSDDPRALIKRSGDCGNGGEKHEWEDDAIWGRWDYQDFVYTIECKTEATGKFARLVE